MNAGSWAERTGVFHRPSSMARQHASGVAQECSSAFGVAKKFESSVWKSKEILLRMAGGWVRDAVEPLSLGLPCGERREIQVAKPKVR